MKSGGWLKSKWFWIGAAVVAAVAVWWFWLRKKKPAAAIPGGETGGGETRPCAQIPSHLAPNLSARATASEISEMETLGFSLFEKRGDFCDCCGGSFMIVYAQAPESGDDCQPVAWRCGFPSTGPVYVPDAPVPITPNECCDERHSPGNVIQDGWMSQYSINWETNESHLVYRHNSWDSEKPGTRVCKHCDSQLM